MYKYDFIGENEYTFILSSKVKPKCIPSEHMGQKELI